MTNTPSLAFDFTADALDSRVAFSRTLNTATRFNQNGLLEVVSADTPRFNFDPVTNVCRGLLIEEARTNRFTHSSNFADASWFRTSCTIQSDAAIAPDGTQTADTLVMDNGVSPAVADQSGVFKFQTLTSGVYVYSIFAKPAGVNSLRVRENAATGSFLTVDLTTGSITGGAPQFVNPIALPLKDGWWWVAFTSPTMSNTNKYSVRTGTTGDGVNGIHIWGADIQLGAYPTSHIPTTTAAVTRNADVATITGTAFSGIWRSGPGSILVRALPSTVSGTRPLVQVDDATADNIIALRGNTTNPELYIRAGGSDQATIDAGTISAAAYRLAGSWKAGNGVATLNGFAPVKGTPASIPAATQMRLGSDGTNYLNGHLQSLEYWDEFLTPATLQSVTTSAGYRSIVGPVMRDTIIA